MCRKEAALSVAHGSDWSCRASPYTLGRSSWSGCCGLCVVRHPYPHLLVLFRGASFTTGQEDSKPTALILGLWTALPQDLSVTWAAGGLGWTPAWVWEKGMQAQRGNADLSVLGVGVKGTEGAQRVRECLPGTHMQGQGGRGSCCQPLSRGLAGSCRPETPLTLTGSWVWADLSLSI